MRMIAVLLGWMLIFALLLRAAPPALALPLYCAFTLAGIGYLLWERRAITSRRIELERQLDRQRLEAQRLPWGNGAEEE